MEKRDAKGGGHQQLFDILAQASGYRYLKESVGCSIVHFVPETKGETHDLEGMCDGARVLCEMKTINISDLEIKARVGPTGVRKGSGPLDSLFFRKLGLDISKAKSQLESFDPIGEAQHLVYIRICFDDWSGVYDDDFFWQIDQHFSEHPPAIKVVVTSDSGKTSQYCAIK